MFYNESKMISVTMGHRENRKINYVNIRFCKPVFVYRLSVDIFYHSLSVQLLNILVFEKLPFGDKFGGFGLLENFRPRNVSSHQRDPKKHILYIYIYIKSQSCYILRLLGVTLSLSK